MLDGRIVAMMEMDCFKIFMKLASEKTDSVKKHVITTITGKIYLFIDNMNKLVVKYFFNNLCLKFWGEVLILHSS